MKSLIFMSVLSISSLFGCPKNRVTEPSKFEKMKIFIEYKIERAIMMVEYDIDKDIDATEDIAKLDAYVEVWDFMKYIEQDTMAIDW